MDNSVAAVAPWNKDNANQPFVKEKVKAAAHKIFMQIATGVLSEPALMQNANLQTNSALHARRSGRLSISSSIMILSSGDRTAGLLSSTVPLVPARTSLQAKFLLMSRRLTSWTSKRLWRRRRHSR